MFNGQISVIHRRSRSPPDTPPNEPEEVTTLARATTTECPKLLTEAQFDTRSRHSYHRVSVWQEAVISTI